MTCTSDHQYVNYHRLISEIVQAPSGQSLQLPSWSPHDWKGADMSAGPFLQIMQKSRSKHRLSQPVRSSGEGATETWVSLMTRDTCRTTSPSAGTVIAVCGRLASSERTLTGLSRPAFLEPRVVSRPLFWRGLPQWFDKAKPCCDGGQGVPAHVLDEAYGRKVVPRLAKELTKLGGMLQ